MIIMFDRQITPEFLEFCGHVWAGLEHADAKHGTWSGMPLVDCAHKIYDEADEVMTAANNNDIDSPHGIKSESVQVAVTAYKMYRRVSV